MRASQFFIHTLKETPADAEVISHQLMLRAGLIRKLSTGIYSYLPLGLKVLRHVEDIIREELNQLGAVELLMPTIQPATLWQETGRWDSTGAELLKIQDRYQRDCCFGPTHEEVVTDIVRKSISSYKQLPLTVYQIQTKFRDEIRPRFGVMRAREFFMKDAYSFHHDEASLEETYDAMYEAYCRIFQRLGLRFRAVLADSGNIGGKRSHEFHVLAESGEDTIAYCDHSDYAANIELATSATPSPSSVTDGPALEKVDTMDTTTIESLCALLKIRADETVKVVLVEGSEQPLIACIVRGDHTINATKLEKHPLVRAPLVLANSAAIMAHLQQEPGYIGPINLPIPLIIDPYAAAMDRFVCGANIPNTHYINAIWDRDCPLGEVMDIRAVCEGDMSPDQQGALQFTKGIEVGHIFNLGTKYSQAMQASALDAQGKPQPMIMGCYGIGVSRLIAAAIEQSHDERGIIWPEGIAPFTIHLLPMNYKKSTSIQEASEALYTQLRSAGLSVLLDDRDLRAGSLFADADLIGIPHQVVIGERNLAAGVVEYKNRRSGEKHLLSTEALIALFQ